MFSTLVDVPLFLALAATTVCIIMLYRRLKRLDAGLEGYRRMIELCPAGRAGTPDEVGNVGALLMGADGAFITGSDFLMDGGVTASYRFGDLAPK